MEETFLSAMKENDYSHQREGAAILSKYGYDSSLPLSGNIPYRQAESRFIILILSFLLSSFILVTTGFIFIHKKYQKQQAKIYSLLDKCFMEDYSFLEQQKEAAADDIFTDTLFKLAKKLQIKTAALWEERDHTKTLVTDISHQLKTPISALKNCFAICMEADSKEEQDEFLNRCAMQIEKLENLITGLIHISYLETSFITLKPEEWDLTDILAKAVDTVYIKALEKKISIEVQHNEDTSLRLNLDGKWTVEAFANILDNAVKYSPANSSITLRVYKLYSHVCIEIEDEGIGISKEEYNKIFKRFYRGSSPSVRNAEGSGVGLYLTRKIIESQKGTVMVKPAPKQICGAPAFFERMGIEPVLGKKISISFRPGERGKIITRDFTICGIEKCYHLAQIEETEISDNRILYPARISKALIEQYEKSELYEPSISADIKVYGEEDLTYPQMIEKIESVAADIGIKPSDMENNIVYNKRYLRTMTDPGTETISIVSFICLIVIFFFVLVIYSIYYVGIITDIQEIGKLKAMGASKKQIRRTLLGQGGITSLFAIPPGLILEYLLVYFLFPVIMDITITNTSILGGDGGSGSIKVPMFSLPILLGVAAAVLFGVYLSLLKSMRMAGKISPVEAIRYQESSTKKKMRKGCRQVNVAALTYANLARNKKRTVETVGLACFLSLGQLFITLFINRKVIRGSLIARIRSEE